MTKEKIKSIFKKIKQVIYLFKKGKVMSIAEIKSKINGMADAFSKLDENISEAAFRQAYSDMLKEKDIWQYMDSDKYSAFLLRLISFLKKYDGNTKALDCIEDLCPDYEKYCVFDYYNKYLIHEEWAHLLVAEDVESKAYEHLKKATYFLLIDNVFYDGFEFFSFRNFSEYALDDIRNNTICLAHPSTYNDPMDTILFRWNQYLHNESDNENEKNLRLLYQKVFDHIKVRCFVRTSKLPVNEKDDVKNKLSKKQNIEDVNPLMWAHYANYHKGFCIKYKFPAKIVKNEDEAKLILTRVGNVDYKPTMVFSAKNVMSVRDALFAKHDVWAYENEVRIVRFDPSDDKNFSTVSIPEDCIKEIYLGLKCSDENREKMKLTLRNRNIKLFQMKVDSKDSYKLVKERIL